MSGKPSGLWKRLAKVEQQLADRARRAELANCHCRGMTMVFTPEQFEAEMNRTCPAHGFRRLGTILAVGFVKPDKTVTEESAKLMQRVETYNLRLSQLPQAGVELER
jgi:hypothetical protein